MTQPSGWYDDPQDPSQLRYWDGVVWSSHITPKVSPTVEQSNIGMPYNVTPAAARAQAPGSQGAQGTPADQGRFGSPQQGQQDQGQPGQGQQDQGEQGQGGQWPAYGQGPGSLATVQQGWESHPATTPDGVRLAGWWIRLLARFLDGIFTFIVSLPFTGWFYYKYLVGVLDMSRDLADQAASGSVPVTPFPPMEILQYALAASIVGFLISGVYEVFFLTRTGATPGKMIVGISVRLRERPGPPPMGAALGRTAVYLGFALVTFGTLLDCLWPLWDDKKQAIHDKAASTNVVVGSQPKRDA